MTRNALVKQSPVPSTSSTTYVCFNIFIHVILKKKMPGPSFLGIEKEKEDITISYSSSDRALVKFTT